MPCLVVLIAMMFPRLALVVLAIFSSLIGSAFSSWLWPILGFIFMPITTLVYVGAMHYAGGVHGLWVVAIIIAVLSDLGAGSTTAATSRRGSW